MKKTTLKTDFPKIFFRIKITQNSYHEKTRGTFHQLLCFFMLLLMITQASWGQAQIIGSFPNTQGGLENQTVGAVPSTLSATTWHAKGSGSAVGAISSTSPRTGGRCLTFNSGQSTNKYLGCPTSLSLAASTVYTIQYFYKTPDGTTTSTSYNFGSSPTDSGTFVNNSSTISLAGTSGSWSTVRTISYTTGPAAHDATGWIGIRTVGNGTNKIVDFDDICIYAGAADNTAPDAPTSLTVDASSGTQNGITWTAPGTGVDGGGYVVVRYATNPNADNDPNVNGIYGVNNTINNGTGALVGTVVYVGTGLTHTDVITSPSTYYYKVYTVDKAFNYSTELTGNGTASCPTYTLTSTTSPTPICAATQATVTLNGAAANLPVGSYTVTYNLSGDNTATANTAPMSVATAGTGTFTTSALTAAGSTTITVTQLVNSGCTSAISTNHTTSVTTTALPTITGTTPASRSGTGTVALGATASAGTISWFAAPSGGTALSGATGTTTSTFTTPSISSTTTYYAETTNGSCKSARTAVIATVTGPEIDVRGNSISIVNNDLTPTNGDFTYFGSVDFSSGTISRTFFIHNTGSSVLSISSVTKGGSNPGDFTITTSPSATVNAAANTSLVISFDPSAAGTRSATITIANDDGDENPYVFAISGNGVETFYDSDGDGITDNVDDDDDNDGILDTTEELNCTNANGTKTSYNFLTETFGTGARGPLAGTDYCYEDGIPGASGAGCNSAYSVNDGEYTLASNARVSAWSDGTTDTKWYQGLDHTPGDGTTGRMAIFNAQTNPGIFYTATIMGTLPGIPITYSFWALNLDRLDDPDIANRTRPNITVEFRDMSDVLLNSINTGPIAPSAATTSASDWHQFTASLSLPANTFKVTFINNATTTSGNDLAIDDITITQSLCDYDIDGVADVYDLDSDNDGIPDVVEAGLGSLSNGRGKIDVAWVDANTNGVHDSAQATANLPTRNSDSDSLPDYLDLDSDNDSVFDIDESGAGNSNAAVGYVNGDGDINGDGMGDGADTQIFRSKEIDSNGIVVLIGDGILDLFDYDGAVSGSTFNAKYGNLNQANPIDTDSDGTPDYLDITSNGSTFDIASNKSLYAPKVIDADNNGILDGTVDLDKDGILDSFDTDTATKGSPRDLNKSLYLDFDGRNDYAQSTAILGGLTNASLMAWISLNPTFASEGVVVGQNNFHIRITNSRNLEVVVNGTALNFGTALNVSQWYNVGATFNGTNLKLYLNGNLVGTQAIAGAINADASLLTIGRDPNLIGPGGTKHFKGKIDEIRVFNTALSDNEMQRMVYQEIDETSPKLKGKLINKEIAQDLVSSPTGALNFSNLLRYYRMDTYKNDIIDDLSTPTIDLTGTKIYNHKYINLQQAPMPFVTIADGDLATSITDPTKDIQGTDVNNYNTIVNVKHNNTSTVTRTDVGLIVDSSKSLTVNGDSGLNNTWWLSLNGKIDLEGKSQLVQNSTSDLDVTSSGSIDRDQQGQTNVYNYNYWSSPVSTINTSTNNNGYTLADIMKDGTTSTPQNITWVAGYDGSPTSPISLARYWLHKFENNNDVYANWIPFTETDAIRSGQGYLLKGSGAATTTQNYTFTGKPNNGLINTNIVSANNLLLVGNPYPSALDATTFINNNLNSTGNAGATDGNIYFWEHAPNNNTHVLAAYLGGYSVRNLVGGLGPVQPSGISGIGSSTKIPNRYIPVGQGFFVYGRPGTGGAVIFNNGQRAFVKENDPTSNAFFRTKATSKININDGIDNYKRIRLGYNTSNGYHRQVLLGFMDDKATSGIDYGYDAEIMDDLPNDMYLVNGEKQLVIGGEGYFNLNGSYPLGLKVKTAGKVSFVIDDLEHFDSEQSIFIHDNLTDTYHNIRESKFEIEIPAGNNNTRFSLRFTNKTLSTNKNTFEENAIQISHLQKGNILDIKNVLSDATIESIALFNTLGQSIMNLKIENPKQQNIQIPLKNVSSGVYITKIKTSKGDLSKKIIVK